MLQTAGQTRQVTPVLLYFLSFWDRTSHKPGCPPMHCVVNDDLGFLVLLLSPKYVVLGIEPKASCVLGKCPTCFTSPGPPPSLCLSLLLHLSLSLSLLVCPTLHCLLFPILDSPELLTLCSFQCPINRSVPRYPEITEVSPSVVILGIFDLFFFQIKKIKKLKKFEFSLIFLPPYWLHVLHIFSANSKC